MIKIAVLGYGTVGGGVVEVLGENPEGIAQSAGEPISVKYICDVRDFPGDPNEALLVKDFAVVEADPEVSIVVETIGGTGVAFEFTKRALCAGKSVVTSNKELVATRGQELIAVARANNVNYLFEASVGGGIPLLRPLVQCLCANRIEEIYGILNGTTNYILDRMGKYGDDPAAALRQAQALGYAEKDPSDDVDGIDPCRKACILSALAFGRQINPAEVRTEGIRAVTLADIKNAEAAGYKIKLLVRAIRRTEGVCVFVAPQLISKANILSGADGVMNGAVVRGSAVGEVMFYGPGAGKRYTASAVVADVMDCARYGRSRRPGFDWDEASPGWLQDPAKLPSRWYVRAEGAAPGGAERISGDAFITQPMDKSALDEYTAGLKVLSRFRLLD